MNIILVYSDTATIKRDAAEIQFSEAAIITGKTIIISVVKTNERGKGLINSSWKAAASDTGNERLSAERVIPGAKKERESKITGSH